MVMVVQWDSSCKSPWVSQYISLARVGEKWLRLERLEGPLLTFPKPVQNRISFWIFSPDCANLQSLSHSHCKRTLLSQGCWKGSDLLLIGMQCWKNCKEYLQVLSLNQNHQLFWIPSLTSFFRFVFPAFYKNTFAAVVKNINPAFIPTLIYLVLM